MLSVGDVDDGFVGKGRRGADDVVGVVADGDGNGYQQQLANLRAEREKYMQMYNEEEDKKKTTFITPWGGFSYRVMPFGLTNAPATFTRFMTLVFQPFFGSPN